MATRRRLEILPYLLGLFLGLNFQIHAVSGKAEITDLTLTPFVSTIEASWSNSDTSGIADYLVTWQDSAGGQEQYCVVAAPYTNTGHCFDIPTLSSCTEYTVTVHAQNAGSSNTGIPASDVSSTLTEAAPIVTKLVAETKSSDVVSLSWTRPNTACEIISYDITYMGKVLWEQAVTNKTSISLLNNNAEEINYMLHELESFTEYWFTVSASTEEGSAKEVLISATTYEAKPSNPTSVSATAGLNRTILVGWYSPTNHGGIITNYTLSWQGAGDDDVPEENIVTLPADVRQYNITDLEGCQPYNFFVRASNDAGTSDSQGSNVEYATEEGWSLFEITSCRQTSKGIFVAWTPPSSCDIYSYRFYYSGYSQWHSPNPYISDSFIQNDTECFIPWNPYMDYSVSVGAVYQEFTMSTDIVESCSLVTMQGSPSAPIDLEPDIHGQTYLSLHWSEPTYANGVIQKYEVSWESEDVEYGIYGSDMVENVNEYTYYTIGGLEPDTVFTVTVRAFTDQWGPEATIKMGTEIDPSLYEYHSEGLPTGAIVGISIIGALSVLLVVLVTKRIYDARRVAPQPTQNQQIPVQHF